MRDFARDWDHALARAVFTCARCGEIAARVALVLEEEGAGHSRERAAGLITESGFFGEWEQVVGRTALMAVAEALVREDAAALYDIEMLWAPFYCHECHTSYCSRHWQMKVIFDDEWPDWYDYTQGACPEGHIRVIDD